MTLRNLAPRVHAGPDQQLVLTGGTAQTVLDGSASADADGSLVAWAWRQLSGPGVATLVTPHQRQTLATGLVAGHYQFELSCTDDRGAVARDSANVTVTALPHRAPVADAGPDQQLSLAGTARGQAVLDGSASHDPDGAVVAFAWRQLSGSVAVIHSPGQAQTVVSGLAAGLHVFELRVTDDRGASAADSVAVTVLPAAVDGEGPVARAGRDQLLLLPQNATTLDGSASSARSGLQLAFFWEQVGGAAAGCASGHDSARLRLTQLVRGSTRYRLTVTDAQGRSASDEVVVTVQRPPRRL